MTEKYFKYFPIFLLIFFDYLSVITSIYLSAISIQIGFIPLLDLFLYYSIIFFVLVFVTNYLLKNYSYLNRSFGLENIKKLLLSSLIIFLLIYTFKIFLELFNINLYFYDNYFFSIRNIINQVILFCFFSIVLRLIVNILSNKVFNKSKKKKKQNFVIYGAGRSGLSLIENITTNNDSKPLFIIDDNPSKIGRFVQNIKIISFGEFENIILENKDLIKQVVFCIPSLESIKAAKIKSKIINLGLIFKDYLNKSGDKNDLSYIIQNISDHSQNINENINDEIKSYFNNKIVLVTGAGGSIGKEICYKISKLNIKKLIAIDIDEYRLSKINRELINHNPNLSQKYENFLLDVNNKEILSNIFKENKPDIVYHASASKHVDLVENNWFYGSINNIQSTYNVCECSVMAKVKKVIFISTDKAVEPINFLGISKSVGEKIIKIFGNLNNEINFSTVRFGNVVGSSGSLLDVIQHQLEISNVINVTDKNMTRYFMTISDAVNLVLISTKISENGDCHVLKMGEPVKIIDVVNSIVEHNNNYLISGKSKIKIRFTGKRPGEKLNEKLYDPEKIEKTVNKYILNEKKPLLNSNIKIDEFLINLRHLSKDKNKFKKTLYNFIEN